MDHRSQRTHYHSLDAWRGVAALAVVFFHAFSPWIENSAPDPFRSLGHVAGYGYLGVHLFFVISGYCIAQIAFREIQSGRNAAGFLRNRLLRIFPPYWCACIFAAALALAALPFNQGHLNTSDQATGALPGSFQAALSHFLLIDPWFNRPTFILVAWTLGWEVSFYLITTALVVVGIKAGLRWAIVCGLFGAALGTLPEVTNTLPMMGGWSEFSFGACTFAAIDAPRRGGVRWPWLAAIYAFIAAALLQGAPSWHIVFAAGFALLLVGLHRFDGIVAHTQPLKCLTKLGLFSYSIYLIHAPVVGPLRNLAARYLPSNDASFLTVIVIAGTLSVAVSWLFYRVIESPLEHWRRQFGHQATSAPLL